ncbi:FBP domain-containing protein [Streptomyces sp. NPDC050560]|uniref:FBP domain-containing protein n=1 Tax=Streptomyces sp. NPDC050560 TaxID=3365630 RepID=UPI0037A2E716
MKPLTEKEIRAAFVNCTKGEAKRLYVPRDLAERPWGDLDYLGWRDPQSTGRAYLVAELDGAARGVALRLPGAASWQARRSMCSICLVTHTNGVSLMVAQRAGKAGKQGDSVGAYICTDLACSLYVRGRKDTGEDFRAPETLTTEEKVARMTANLAAFVAKVRGVAGAAAAAG